MKKILLCSSSPLLIKGLYASLRDEGYTVEDVEHPSLAVQKVLQGAYDLMIIDAEPFGLSAGDAARIVGAIAPGMPILGLGGEGGGGLERLPLFRAPADLDAIKEIIHHVAA
jgi:DNA-binding response OmpR family regulator